MAKKALITGITGQDGRISRSGSWPEGYEVHGIVRRTAATYSGQLEHVYAKPGLIQNN